MLSSQVLAACNSAQIDPNAGSVVLLLHGDGTEGSQSIVDSSNSQTVNIFGTARIKTDQAKSGNGSMYFDGASYIGIPDSDDFHFGSLDFTIEFWLYPLTNDGYWLMGKGDGTSRAPSAFSFYNVGNWEFYYGTSVVSLARPSLDLNVWQHIAIVRDGAMIKMYKNGVMSSSVFVGNNVINTGSPHELKIGLYSKKGYNGYIDELRITKGVARYTSDFTPSNAPFPNP